MICRTGTLAVNGKQNQKSKAVIGIKIWKKRVMG
jgi:hypothetical protein